MNREQKIARLSNAQQVLARRTSELFEPGYDPYNSLNAWRKRHSTLFDHLLSAAWLQPKRKSS